ncbi:MAG: CheR family methyltransferase [Aestuariibacter sp.]
MQPKQQTRDKTKEFGYSREQFNRLRSLANSYSGISVSDEKYEMYYSRLTKRLRIHQLKDFADYVALVENDPREFKEFINSITTNVTSFGREQHHFDYLINEVKQCPGREFNVWSAGCSSGEEPYSIVLNILPLCEQQHIDLNVTATDLDTGVLRKGIAGVYPLQAIEQYDIKVKRTFFEKGTGSNVDKCRVKKQYRKLVKFQQLNLMHEWRMRRKYDAIFCRNVLIYFDNPKKQRLLDMYYHCLKPKGLLFLGHSESLHNITSGFDSVGKTIYRRRD